MRQHMVVYTVNDSFITLICFPFRPITKASSTSQSTSCEWAATKWN